LPKKLRKPQRRLIVVNCRLCAAPAMLLFTAVDPRESNDKPYPLYRCPACGVAFTPATDVRYDPSFFEIDRFKRATPFMALRRRRIASFVSKGRILDYGCGAGAFVRSMHSLHDVDAYGFDPHGTSADNRLFSRWEDVIVHAPFDLVTFWHSFEHLENPELVLESLKKIVTPKAKIYFCLPDFGSDQARFNDKWFHLDLPRHQWHHDRSSFEYLLKRCGYRPIHWYSRTWEYDLAGWLGTWWNALLPRRNAWYNFWKGRRRQDASFILSFLSMPFLGPAAAVRTLLPGGGATLAVTAEIV
jgi:SAM-dependent methyltransferase